YGVTADGRHAVLGSLPGETLTVKPFTHRRKKAYCRIENIEISSPERVTPPCSVANTCGGCSLQHHRHGAQIAHKQSEWLATLMTKPQELLPPLLGPEINYRSKARLGVRYVEKKQKVLVGFREKMTGYITETDVCKILRLPVGDMIVPLVDLIMSLSDPKGVPQIEVAVGDNQTALVVRHLSELTESDFTLLRSFADTQNIQLYLQQSDPASVYRLYPTEGSEYLYYDLPDFDIRMYFTPLDFTQVNHSINRLMVTHALQLLGAGSDDVVLDAFSGIGNFSLALARGVKHVYGVEFSEQSVLRGNFNAKENSIENVTFLNHDLFETPMTERLKSVSHVLLDPPRSGAETLVKTLAGSDVIKVVYVSCNPLTLARDAETLVNAGYHFDKAGVIDMFPHTNHIESIAVFSR
ncbi:MAG: 23S rRNA (uracil(1939)-C(5))-methyltransferase RlmD, partial [Pseudomonadales bacterium]|nr:23S rRNA (uracil(1939)-C(5))-methyltransferase RlmD [Pseudomonadales bacterium]